LAIWNCFKRFKIGQKSGKRTQGCKKEHHNFCEDIITSAIVYSVQIAAEQLLVHSMVSEREAAKQPKLGCSEYE
jgi:hypothetical protein